MMDRDLFIEAQDVLSPRGNQSFGDPGEHAAAQLIPWPSVIAGALRSAALSHSGYSSGKAIGKLVSDNAELAQRLALPGVATHSEAFKLGYYGLAQQKDDVVLPLMPIPNDLFVSGSSNNWHIKRATPAALKTGIVTSSQHQMIPILHNDDNSKPLKGLWLNADGWRVYCAGELPQNNHIVSTADIASRRTSVGIGMDATLRRAQKGQLYTAERIEFRAGLGYWARVHNAHECHTDNTLLRLGGDGHAARLHKANVDWPDIPIDTIARHKRFVIALCSPALFENGNAPPAISDNGHWNGMHFSARLVARSASRAQTISGWDLQKNRPKTARRFVPAGAIYWFDEFSGDPQALLAELAKGCWHDPLADSEHRLVEGFNQIQLLAWYGDNSEN